MAVRDGPMPTAVAPAHPAQPIVSPARLVPPKRFAKAAAGAKEKSLPFRATVVTEKCPRLAQGDPEFSDLREIRIVDLVDEMDNPLPLADQGTATKIEAGLANVDAKRRRRHERLDKLPRDLAVANVAPPQQAVLDISDSDLLAARAQRVPLRRRLVLPAHDVKSGAGEYFFVGYHLRPRCKL